VNGLVGLTTTVCERPLFTKNKFAIANAIAIINDLRKNFFILIFLGLLSIVAGIIELDKEESCFINMD